MIMVLVHVSRLWKSTTQCIRYDRDEVSQYYGKLKVNQSVHHITAENLCHIESFNQIENGINNIGRNVEKIFFLQFGRPKVFIGLAYLLIKEKNYK